MIAPIKLSDLVAARAAMTPGPWHLDDDTPCVYGGNDQVGDYEILVISEEAGNYDGDAAGLVATHNAADVLIEIALAALEYDTAMRAPGTRGISARRGDAAMRLHAALAKVTP